MSGLTLSFAAKTLKGELLGNDCVFKGVNTDTRKVVAEDLFVALKGAKVDGHDFIKEAEGKGAVAVLASRKINTSLPIILVADTLSALGQLAKAYRKQFELPMVAITGSCGKTTVKEMLTSILSLQGSNLSNQGNLNTEVGVPLTLLRLLASHQTAVVEMGARKKGDIAYLMDLANPTVSLITNAGVAHLEVFGSERGVAEAKGEIYQCLRSNGVAIVNLDDANADYWKGLLKSGQKLLTFGLDPKANITARSIRLATHGTQLELVTDIGKISVHLLAPGKHNVINALAATAAARALGINSEIIRAGLEKFMPVTGRLQFKTGLRNVQIMDDTYNANPISVRAALAVLAQTPGQKIFVMGDMFELGPNEVLLHRQIGEEAKHLGIQKLFGVGSLMSAAVEGFGQGATHYPDKASLVNALSEYLNQDTTVLVKGSRGMRMEEVVLAITTNCQESVSC